MRRSFILAATLLCLGAGSLARAQVPKPTEPLPEEPADSQAQNEAHAQRAAERAARQQAASKDLIVRYTGELIDNENNPISGVFGVTFRLYEEEDSKQPIWSERLFVAVDLGTYTIDLGQQTPLAQNLTNQRRWLSVSVDTLGELLREQVVLRPYTPARETAPERIRELSFAALADRAVSADTARVAEDAERLGGKTLADLDRYPELYRQVVELRSQVQAIRNSGGTRVARRTTTTETTGGPGGVHFRITCPEGQVVVGITGRAGSAIDALGLVCAPLEHVH